MFWPMQGPTTWRWSKAQPDLTQQSSHVLRLLLLLCLLLDGKKWIGGHFSNHFWKENTSPALATNQEPNRSGTFSSGPCATFKVSPDKWLPASHLWGAVFSTAVPSLYYLFSSAFPSSYSDHPYPFISKYCTIIYNYRTWLWSLSEFPTAFSCLCVLRIPDLRFKWWPDNLPFTLKLPLHHSANLSKIWFRYCKAHLGHDF